VLLWRENSLLVAVSPSFLGSPGPPFLCVPLSRCHVEIIIAAVRCMPAAGCFQETRRRQKCSRSSVHIKVCGGGRHDAGAARARRATRRTRTTSSSRRTRRSCARCRRRAWRWSTTCPATCTSLTSCRPPAPTRAAGRPASAPTLPWQPALASLLLAVSVRSLLPSRSSFPDSCTRGSVGLSVNARWTSR